jgi:hypothetical protein
MFRPCVTVRDLNGGIAELPSQRRSFISVEHYPLALASRR